RWLKKIIADPQAAGERSFTALPPARQALVLDAASDYFLYKLAGESGDAAAYRERNRAVLLARSKLRVPFAPLAIEPFAGPPEHARGIRRGLARGRVFQRAQFSPGLPRSARPGKRIHPRRADRSPGHRAAPLLPERSNPARPVYSGRHSLAVADERSLSESVVEGEHRIPDHSSQRLPLLRA